MIQEKKIANSALRHHVCTIILGLQQADAHQNETAFDVVSTTAPGADETVLPASDTTSAPLPTVEPVASIAPLAPGMSVTAGGAPGTRSTPRVPSPTTGIDPRPFAVSGVIISTLATTVITPAKRQISARYRSTVTIQAPTGFERGAASAFVFPSRESVWYFLPVKIGRIRHIRNCIKRAQDARYMPSCAQPCGAPLFFEICSARIRVAMNRTHSIGANCTVVFAVSTASFTNDKSTEMKSS